MEIVSKAIPLFLLPEINSLSEPDKKKYIVTLASILILHVTSISILFKHSAYKNEEEYRLLLMRPINEPIEKIHHRIRRNTILKYVDFDWKLNFKNALKEIIIGPAVNEDDARSFIEECLQISGIDSQKVKVNKSKIPYKSA